MLTTRQNTVLGSENIMYCIKDIVLYVLYLCKMHKVKCMSYLCQQHKTVTLGLSKSDAPDIRGIGE